MEKQELKSESLSDSVSVISLTLSKVVWLREDFWATSSPRSSADNDPLGGVLFFKERLCLHAKSSAWYICKDGDAMGLSMAGKLDPYLIPVRLFSGGVLIIFDEKVSVTKGS